MRDEGAAHPGARDSEAPRTRGAKVSLAVPSTIFFAASRGDHLAAVKVEEDISDVHSKMLSGGADQPLLLTLAGTGGKVYVNPLNILWWQSSGESRGSFF